MSEPSTQQVVTQVVAPSGPRPALDASIAEVCGRIGVTPRVHVRDVDALVGADGRPAEYGINADSPAVAASVFKVPVLIELCRRFADGSLSPTQRILVPADERRTEGPSGLSVVLDDVELSLRDLALSMMSVSDNRATDIIMNLLGRNRINQTMRELGASNTVLEGDCQGLFDSMSEDLGESFDEEAFLAGDPAQVARLAAVRALNAPTTNRTTPAETTRLLASIWRDELIDPAGCAEIRRILDLQVWGHRLMTGFPDQRILVAGKTGTLAGVRNEVGVVEYPDGKRFAVAVFLQSEPRSQRDPDTDRAIGTIGRLLVDELRGVDAG